MSPSDGILQGWLTELGQAHMDGAFAGRSARFPWQVEERQVIRLSHRRWAWARAAGPLAAAAAVAVLFVWPALYTSPKPGGVATGIPSTVTPDWPTSLHMAEAPAAEAVPCDFNGDGKVNGADTPAFLEWARANGNRMNVAEVAAQLARCQLGH